MRFLCACWLALLSAACLAAPPKHLRFEQLGVEQGLPHELVQAMLQDRHGFMWIGTQSGLARYDGGEVIFYRRDANKPGGLTDPWVTALYEDGRGRLWVGTHGGGLQRYEPASESFIPYRRDPKDSRGLASDQINAIKSDGANGMWLATADGLAHFDPDTQQFTVLRHDIKQPASLADDRVTALANDGQGNLWVGTAAGLDRWSSGSKQFEHHRLDSDASANPGQNDIHALLLDRAGALWIGTATGLEVWPSAAAPRKRFGIAEGMLPGTVQALYQDKDGTVWLGTQDDGLKCWDASAGRFQPYRHQPGDPHSLADNRVIALLQDRSGVLWVGTWNRGTSRVDLGSSGFERFVHDPDDPHSVGVGRVQGFADDGNGGVWIGTAGGGLNRLDKASGEIVARFRHNPADPNSLSHDTVRAVQINAEGVWVGTVGGLDLLDPASGHFTHFRHNPSDPHSLSSDQIYSLSFDRTGILWVGTSDSGLNRFDRGNRSFQRFQHNPQDPDSLSNPWVAQVLEDTHENLWVATFGGGLDRLDRQTGRFQHFRHDDQDATSLSQNAVTSVLEDRSGTLWIGTTSGLNRMERGANKSIRFKHYSVQDGLENDVVLDIEEAKDGNLWLGTNAGLSRFDPTLGSFKNFTAIDGLIDGTYMVGGGYKDAGGTLYFGGTRGLTTVQPQAIRENFAAPQVAITDFLIFNRSVRGGKNPDGFEMTGAVTEAKALKLPYSDSVFSLEFAGLHFSDPQHNRYAYKLEGFDRDWVYADENHRVATYTNLDPGSYVFRVKAGTKDGVWNDDGAVMAIAITPPFWKTWWFRLAAVLLSLSGGYAAYQARTRHFAYQRGLLERQVHERTAELNHTLKEQQAILDNASTGIAFIKTWKFHRCNLGFESIFGYGPGELIGSSVTTLYDRHSGDTTNNPESSPQIVDHGARLAGDKRFLRKDGSEIWCNGHVKLVDENAPEHGVVLVMHDITARKQAEHELEEINRKLADLSATDGLTGIANRRKFDEVAQIEWLRALRKQEQLSVALIDIDHFKDYNDHYGHQAGDECLRAVATALAGDLRRGSDFIARYGGEEFVVVLPGYDTQSVTVILEKLRNLIVALELPHATSNVAPFITISAGLAITIPRADSTFGSLLQMADKNLYLAKRCGRNQICTSRWE